MTSRYRMTIIHTVPDYDRWVDTVHSSNRHPGVVSMQVFRSLDDPNEVMVDVELDSVETAREILPAEDLRQLLDRAGIEIYPPVFIGELVDELSSRRA
jgi:hypothetical protein